MTPGLKLLPTAAVILCLGAAALFAGFANGYYVFVIATMALTAIVGIGLNVLVGLTGQVSFGHVGFYAIGAYTVAILTTSAKLPFALALALAALLSGLTGALLALPALRVRGPYLAMITIAFAFIVENVAVEWRGITGGQNGIMGIPSPSAFGTSFGERGVALTAIGVTAVLLYAFWRLSVSNWGRAITTRSYSSTRRPAQPWTASRSRRLTRLRTTAPPSFFETDSPSLGPSAPPSGGRLNEYSTRKREAVDVPCL